MGTSKALLGLLLVHTFRLRSRCKVRSSLWSVTLHLGRRVTLDYPHAYPPSPPPQTSFPSLFRFHLLISMLLYRADATIASQATGAMSWAFINALKKNPQQSYVQLLNSIRDELQTRYTQKPQLSCSHPLGEASPSSHSSSSFYNPSSSRYLVTTFKV